MGNKFNCLKNRKEVVEQNTINLKYITDILCEVNLKDISELDNEIKNNIYK